MTNIRRYKGKEQVYFLSHVVEKRNPILVDNADLIHAAWQKLSRDGKWLLMAWAILPDHVHMVVDPLNHDVSSLSRRWKLSFSSLYRKRVGVKAGKVWQNRFWDHVIRDQEDLNRHFDYVHYNAVKHGHADRASAWRYSSFKMFVDLGVYDETWGVSGSIDPKGDFGE